MDKIGDAVPDLPGYIVGRELGKGSRSTVWLATERTTRRDVAIKCFDPFVPARLSVSSPGPPDDDPEAAIRREVRILAMLHHQHLVKAHDVVRIGGADGGRLGLVMDYAAGGSLGQLVASSGPLSAGETVTVLTPIAQALSYLHGKGFTHSDVSPGNVLFSAHGKPLLADLGVTRMVGDAAGVLPVGTEGFVDPAPVDALRARLQPERDVYSLAALGWFCLTGQAPPVGANRPPLPLLVPGVPPALAAALESGLREDRRERSTAAEFAAAVYRSAAAAPVDLSHSAHSSVLPELLTRRNLPETPRTGRTAWLSGWRPRLASIRPPADRSALPAFLGKSGMRALRHVPPAGPVSRGRRSTAALEPSGSGHPGVGAAVQEEPRSHSRRAALRTHTQRPGARSVFLALPAAVIALWLLAGAPLFQDVPSPAQHGGLPGSSAPGSSASPGRVETPEDVTRLLLSGNPEDAARGLAWLRSAALRSGQLDLLDEVNAGGSAAAAADARISSRLRDAGHTLAGFDTTLTYVKAAPESTAVRAVVEIGAVTSAYQETDSAGNVVGAGPAGAEQRLKLVMALIDGRWRIEEILPAT
jgi:serine/threonine protein kinase